MKSGSMIEALTGVAVLVATAVFAWFMVDSSPSQSFENGYRMEAELLTAHGVSVGTEVRMAGIPIGQVTALDLDPERLLALLELAISEEYRIPEDSLLVVAQEGMLGNYVLDFQPGGSLEVLGEGSRVGHRNTQSAVDLTTLLSRVVDSPGS